MYEPIAQKLAAGRPVVLDGATGTDLQRRGVPMDDEVWCATANLIAPAAVQSVHADYIGAGAQVITANTFATSPLLFNALGRDDEIASIDRAAVTLARAARDTTGAAVAIAGSFSVMRPVTRGTASADESPRWSARQAKPLMQAKAEALAEAGCDLIIMEMMRDCDYSVWATEAAVATGLPVWVGIAVERRADGRLVGFGRQDWTLEDIVAALMGTGALACLIMHNEIDLTAEALEVVTSQWAGPLGAYPESGYFEMPEWQFVDIIAPDKFAAHCLQWRRQGASILGGCCGIGPEHIAALSAALRMEA
jgi:homocysteine S-methyltransferase